MGPKAAPKAKAGAKGSGKDDKKPAAKPAASAASPSAKPADGGSGSQSDFEAGILFSRYDTTRTGVLTAEDFRKMWKDTAATSSTGGGIGGGAQSGGVGGSGSNYFNSGMNMNNNNNNNSNSSNSRDPTSVIFEAGQVFSTHDKDGDGKLSKLEFESLIKSNPQILKLNNNRMMSDMNPLESRYPLEMITGRLLTHYDETARVPISSDLIDQHTSMSHVVVPLIDAYKTRYDRLRSLLASKVLPKKEQLLHIKRQLHNAAAEIASTSGAIERETLVDAEKIIEKLRAVESMRQSSISHQSLQLEEELEHIERLVRRVEQANIISEFDNSSSSSFLSSHSHLLGHMGIGSNSGVQVTSAVAGGMPPPREGGGRAPPRANSMVELIQQFQDICMSIDKIASKQLSVQVEFSTDDFPRESSDRLEIISRCDQMSHSMQVKDHMLWTSIQAQKQAEEALEEERRLSHEYAEEVTQWAEVAGDIKQELVALKNDNESLLRRNRELIDILRRNNLLFAAPGLAFPI